MVRMVRVLVATSVVGVVGAVACGDLESAATRVAEVTGLVERQPRLDRFVTPFATVAIPPGVGPGRVAILWIGHCDPRFANTIDLAGAADETWQETWHVDPDGFGRVELSAESTRPWAERHLEIVASNHCEHGVTLTEWTRQ